VAWGRHPHAMASIRWRRCDGGGDTTGRRHRRPWGGDGERCETRCVQRGGWINLELGGHGGMRGLGGGGAVHAEVAMWDRGSRGAELGADARRTGETSYQFFLVGSFFSGVEIWETLKTSNSSSPQNPLLKLHSTLAILSIMHVWESSSPQISKAHFPPPPQAHSASSNPNWPI
jgi:hypothetical protein